MSCCALCQSGYHGCICEQKPEKASLEREAFSGFCYILPQYKVHGAVNQVQNSKQDSRNHSRVVFSIRLKTQKSCAGEKPRASMTAL